MERFILCGHNYRVHFVILQAFNVERFILYGGKYSLSKIVHSLWFIALIHWTISTSFLIKWFSFFSLYYYYIYDKKKHCDIAYSLKNVFVYPIIYQQNSKKQT